MNVEVHLQRIRKGKTSSSLVGVVPDLEVESYEEALKHPEVREMIIQAYGKYFQLTMYCFKGRNLEVTEVEITKSKAI